MSDQPVPEVPEVTHRKRRANWWKSMPRQLRITAVACLGLVVVGGITIGQRWFKAPPPTAAPPPPSPGEVFDTIKETMAPIDLVLSKSNLNPATRRIEGLVTNSSERFYSNILVSFYLPSRDLSRTEITTVTIRRLAPHESAKFATDPVNPDVKQWHVRDIKGTPGDAPPADRQPGQRP